MGLRYNSVDEMPAAFQRQAERKLGLDREKVKAVGKLRRGATKSDLEAYFDGVVRMEAPELGPWVQEYHFATRSVPGLLVRGRKWRFDRALPEVKVAVEIQGMAHGRRVKCHACGVEVRARRKDGRLGGYVTQGGAHVQGGGFENDREKTNMAQAMGWVVIELTAGMLKNSRQWLVQIRRVVAERRGA